ncbi:hypothetical protein CsSME_00012598 [Camellia sinensis var. sinensis]
MVEKDARNLCDIWNDDRNDARNWRSTEGFGSTGRAALEYRREDSDSDSTLNVIAMMEEEAETEYPQITKLKALIAKRQQQQPQYLLSSSSAVTSHYNPPQDSMMGPPGYPPATGHGPSINIPERPSYTGGRSNFRREAKDEMWNLPSAMHHTGAMFVIPQSLGRFDDAFMRWESITRSYVASQGFTDVRDKLLFMENLLGETEKLIWTQWRKRYADKYANLVAIGDGNEVLYSTSLFCNNSRIGLPTTPEYQWKKWQKSRSNSPMKKTMPLIKLELPCNSSSRYSSLSSKPLPELQPLITSMETNYLRSISKHAN